MSGYWRFCVAAFLLLAGLSTWPAFSNPLTDLFNPAPKEAAAPAPAREECLLQPGRSTAPGQHWVYRLDGHRKCWFQADEATVAVKKQAHHYGVKQPVIAAEENEAALREKTVADARAQLLSAAPADASQPDATARPRWSIQLPCPLTGPRHSCPRHPSSPSPKSIGSRPTTPRRARST